MAKSKGRYMKVILFFVFLLMISSCTTTISGTIVQEDGKHINQTKSAKVNISFLDQENSDWNEVVDLDIDGTFTTNKDLQPGYYLVEPLIPGYAINSVRLFVDQDKVIKIIAKPLREQSSKLIQIQKSTKLHRGSGGAQIAPPKL